MSADAAERPGETALQSVLDRLTGFLSERLGRSIEIAEARQFPSGFSWITIGFAIAPPGIEGESRLILRMGPQNGLYSPYSAQPQFAVLDALAGSDVPAPRAFFWSDDPSVLGMPFFISAWSPGDAPIPWGDAGEPGGSYRAALGAQFADALGALHALDWQPTPLAKIGDGITLGNAAQIQIDTWERDVRRWSLRPHPMMTRAIGWLRAHPPTAPRLSVIHGDYRLGNFLAVEDEITAILDWELVHIGDPHEDLAWTCLPQYRGGSPLMSKLIAREELYARHTALTGHAVDPDAMHFYTIFSLVKLAATHMAGAFAFERNGFSDMRMPAMGTQIAPTLRQIEKTLEQAR